MSIYSKLHLENIEIPNSYMDVVLKDGEWFYDELITFDLNIIKLTKGICYACDIEPFIDESDDMEELNEALKCRGFEVSGYGWEEYICEYIENKDPVFFNKIDTDSELDTCGVYVMDSLEDYKQLLFFISESIKDLIS